ncbi:MAG: GNAT family N-acetyltransferase [Rhizobiaceae bacterium]
MDATRSALDWDVLPLTDILPEWNARRNQLTGSMTQRIEWVSQWQSHVNADCVCIVARSGESLELILTLEVIKQGRLKIAIFPGGSHANENFPCLSRTFQVNGQKPDVRHLKSIIKQKRPDIDAVYLHRQVELHDGLSNPILLKEQSVQTDIALSFLLNPDFQVVLDAKDGSKKQKKNRRASRQLDERGGWSYEIITSSSEAEKALNRFFVLKAKRLAAKGIPNVFASQEVQTFFKALFMRSIEQGTGEFEVHVLKLNGAIVAVTGNSFWGGVFNVEFTAVDDTDPTLSHGDFLYFQMISNACARGIKTFSFGVGDEQFKRSWCDIETAQYNTALPITLKGQLASRIESAKTSAKRMVKSNKRLYQFLKNLRKQTKKSPKS